MELPRSQRNHRALDVAPVFLKVPARPGSVIGFGWLAPTARAALAGCGGRRHRPLAPNAFIRVARDNFVTVICQHHEMGQGNTTGLATLVADELDADGSLVRTRYAPADAKLYNNLALGPCRHWRLVRYRQFFCIRGAGPAQGDARLCFRRGWHVPAS